MNDIPEEVSEYMKKIGAKGGKAAAGSKKKRSKAHYQRLGEIHRKRAAKRKKEQT